MSEAPRCRLVSVYRDTRAPAYLYRVLQERLKEPGTNISHNSLPTMKRHLAFMASHPYRAWYLIENARRALPEILGCCYLTKRSEVGIYLHHDWRKMGLAHEALDILRDRHRGRILAHVNPANEASRAFFEREGARLLQVTYELPSRRRA